MKHLLLILIAISTVSFSADAQSRKERRQEKKALQDSIDQTNFTQALIAINDTMLVLQADHAYDQKGNTIMVDDGVNFVKIQKNEGVVQLAFPFLVGSNGVGGFTLDGTVTKYKVSETKRGDITITCSTMGPSLNADIKITLNKGTNTADASVSSITLPYRLNFSGTVVHVNQSTHHQGRPIL